MKAALNAITNDNIDIFRTTLEKIEDINGVFFLFLMISFIF